MIAAIVICPLVFSPLNALRLVSACGLALYGLGVSAQELKLQIDDITAPSFSLRGIEARLSLAQSGQLNIHIAHAQIQQREWQNLMLQCPKASIARTLISCPQGLLESGEKFPFGFKYWPANKRLELVVEPAAHEHWQALLDWRSGQLTATLDVKNGQATRLNPWLPKQALQFSHGVFDLSAQFKREQQEHFEGVLTLHEVAFSDTAGSHAGEKLDATLHLQAQRDTAWQWRTTLAWRAGEVYWQPFYFAPGVRDLSAQGTLNAQQISVEKAQINWAGIGTVALEGTWDLGVKRLESLRISGQQLGLKGLYETFLKPILPSGMLRKLALAGIADGSLQFKQGRFDAVALSLRRGAITHEDQRFNLEGIEGNIAWQRSQVRENRLRTSGGTLGKLALGAFTVDAQLGADQVTLAPLQIPILDGMLSVDGVDARRVATGWQWNVSADLQPISMQRFSQALQLPTMHGTLSAVIPQVSYAQQKLQVNGALLFKVFDGTAVVTDLSVTDVFGPAPHVYANIDMRNLDLTLLTQTFSFGSIQGRLDVTVRDLEVFGWKPVRFDAKVASSAGEYPRKISQRAVENITALGGAGGAAAIQRSFLRFFDQFGYRRIGLNCHLVRGVCTMSGVSEAPNGYVIVEGGGIPALTVIGYNRTVDWDELLARLQRATQGGKPIVQ